jgi:hypothetical protein
LFPYLNDGIPHPAVADNLLGLDLIQDAPDLPADAAVPDRSPPLYIGAPSYEFECHFLLRYNRFNEKIVEV